MSPAVHTQEVNTESDFYLTQYSPNVSSLGMERFLSLQNTKYIKDQQDLCKSLKVNKSDRDLDVSLESNGSRFQNTFQQSFDHKDYFNMLI